MILTLIASAILVLGMAYYMRKTWRGRSWRAITQSQGGAKIMGVDISRESWIAFGTACALAGGAGALVAPLFLVSPTAGGPPLLKSYEVLAIGGMGSIGGSLLGGISWRSPRPSEPFTFLQPTKTPSGSFLCLFFFCSGRADSWTKTVGRNVHEQEPVVDYRMHRRGRDRPAFRS